MKTKILPIGNSPPVRAFTLLEMVVVLAIIGVLSAMALPVYKGIAPRLRISSSTQQLVADLRKARREAILGHRIVAVVFDPAKSEYAFDGHRQSVSAALAVSTDDASEEQPSETPVLHFYKDGSGDRAAIKLSSDTKFATVRINWLTGQVVVEK